MATILMPKGARLDHPALVATLMQQASAVLNHRRKEDTRPTVEQPESLIEGFQNILTEELPYPLEQYTAEAERREVTESSTGTPPIPGEKRPNQTTENSDTFWDTGKYWLSMTKRSFGM